MSEKEQNQLVQKKHPGGRPTKYKPEYCQAIIDYFEKLPKTRKQLASRIIHKNGKIEEIYRHVASDPPFLSGFAHSIGVSHETLHEWTKKHEGFSEAYKKAKDLQLQFFVTMGARNLYAQPTLIFALKNMFGWTDRAEVKHEGVNQVIQINVPKDYVPKKQENRLLTDNAKLDIQTPTA